MDLMVVIIVGAPLVAVTSNGYAPNAIFGIFQEIINDEESNQLTANGVVIAKDGLLENLEVGGSPADKIFSVGENISVISTSDTGLSEDDPVATFSLTYSKDPFSFRLIENPLAYDQTGELNNSGIKIDDSFHFIQMDSNNAVTYRVWNPGTWKC